MRVHFAPGFIIDLRKGRGPVQEGEDNFEGVAVAFGEETAG